MKEPMVITMAREYASGGSEIAQAVADKLGIPLYNKELITLAAKKSGLTEEAIAASENQRSGSLIYSLYMMGNTMPLADQVYILQSNVIKELAAEFSLSARETEIVMLIARGFTTDNVAKKLVISPYTVNTHIRHVYEKVGIHKRSELIDYINRTGSEDDKA